MRVVSQNKKIDVPYEYSVFSINNRSSQYIITSCTYGDSMEFNLARFQEEGEAIKGLEDLRNSYLAGDTCYEFKNNYH